MIAAAMVYTAVVTLLLGLAALAVDRLLALRRWPRRGAWATVLAASFLVPSVMLVSASLRTHPLSAQPATLSFPVTSGAEVTDAKILETPSAYATLHWPVQPRLDPLLLALWVLSTGTVLLWLARASWRFNSAARTWRRRRLGNASVLIADEVGPAVLGVAKPRIVIPGWLLKAPVALRSMVFRHEREHIAAADPVVLRAALLLLSLAPWNVPLWWLLRRLRLAIEIDCDARVLKGGADLGTYGESLLLVSRHRPRTPLAGTALTETVSQLERRIHFMISDTPPPSTALLGILAACALVLCAGAAALDPPSPVSAAELQKSAPGPDQSLAVNLAALVKKRYPNLLSMRTPGTAVVTVLFRPDGSIERSTHTTFDGSPVQFKPTRDYYAQQLNIPSDSVSYVGLQGIVSPATGQTILVAFTERGNSGAPSTPVIGTPDTRQIDRSLTERYFPDVLAGNVDAGVRLWILFDSEGHVLKSGRQPRGDEPIDHVLQTRFPGIETQYMTDTVITDRSAALVRDRAGEPLSLLSVWLKRGSPLPGGADGAAQPDTPPRAARGTAVAIHMKWLINGVNVGTPGGAETFEIKTTTGQEFTRTVSLAPGEVHETACTASLPTDRNLSATWDAVKASAKTSGKPIDHLILLECRLSSNGKVFSRPALAVGDGKTGIIETVDTANRAQIRLELTASRSDKT